MNQPLHRRVIPETYVQLLYEYLESQGYVPESILGEPWPQPTPYAVGGIDVVRWEYLLETAATHLDNRLLALHMGQTITSRHLGVLGAVLHASDNLAAALDRLQRYLRLVFDVVAMNLRTGDDWIDLAWDTREYEPGYMVSECGFTVLVQFSRSLVRGNAHPILVTFRHAAPADVRPYEAFFACPVQFGAPEDLIRYHNAVLTLPLKSPDPALTALLEQHADTLLAQLPQQDAIVQQLRTAIAHDLREGEPDIHRISTQLGYSSRTLQRRLREAGTGFRAELNVVRYQLALSYLRDPRLHILDIAMLLGYSEHSAFTRAFKEWSGQTPQHARGFTS